MKPWASSLSRASVPWLWKFLCKFNRSCKSRLTETDRLRRQQVERAQYEADQARVRFMRVDPNNRLVADTLEGLWNEKLRNLAQAKEDYEKKRQADQQPITSEQQQQILALAQDVPKLWNDPTDQPPRPQTHGTAVGGRRDPETRGASHHRASAFQRRGRPGAQHLAGAAHGGGTAQDQARDRCRNRSPPRDMTDSEVAAELNRRGWRCSVNHAPFTSRAVMILRWTYKLTSRADRLRAKGMLDITSTGRTPRDQTQSRRLLAPARLASRGSGERQKGVSL